MVGDAVVDAANGEERDETRRGVYQQLSVFKPLAVALTEFALLLPSVREGVDFPNVVEAAHETESVVAQRKPKQRETETALEVEQHQNGEGNLERTLESLISLASRELKSRQTELSLRIEQHQEGEGDYRTTLESLISVASRAADIFERSKTEQKRELIAFVFSNLRLRGKKLEFIAFAVRPHDQSGKLFELAVGAVCREPVSTQNSLINREFTGNFADSKVSAEAFLSGSTRSIWTKGQIPTSKNRENFQMDQGNYRLNRDWFDRMSIT